MATATYTATKNAAIKSTSPDTNFSSDTQNRAYRNYSTDANEAVLFGFNVTLSDFNRKYIEGLRLRMYVVNKTDPNPGGQVIELVALSASWSETGATYNNVAYGESIDDITLSSIATSDWYDYFFAYDFAEPGVLQALQNGLCMRVADIYEHGAQTILTVQTRRGANPPQLLIDYQPVSLAIGNRLPSGGFVYAGEDKTFSWTATVPYMGPGAVYGTVTQASAKLRYRKVGESATEISISGATNSYTIPAGTFDGASTYEWQVEVTSNDGVVTTSSWIQFSTTDSTPGKPGPISPINEYAYVDQAIEFEWQHVVDTGTPQTKADLQYSHEGGAWTDFATITGDAQKYTAPANTFTAGKLRWRVRTYNTDGVAGDWSDPAAFIGVGAPAAPVIVGVSAASRPTISWQSVGQVGYQLRLMQDGVMLHDTCEMAGTDKTYTPPLYLANGVYTVSVRVINALQMWSAWAELAFSVAVTPPTAPVITVDPIPNGAHISISGGSGAAHLYLLRGGIPIAEITGKTSYDDYTGIGPTEYVVRAVNASENYADSNAAWVTVSVAAAVIAAVDDPSMVVTMNKKSAGQAPVTGQVNYVGKGVHYAGREHVVYTSSEFTDETYSVAYYYTSINEWKALRELLDRRKTMLYRDVLGNRFYCVGTAVNFTQDTDRVLFALTLQRVDYIEQIDYAEVAT